MLRWLGLFLVLGVATSTADAQVFKPKAKKTETAKSTAKLEKSDATPKKATAKKSARTAPSKKRPTKKKTAAANRDRDDDQASDAAPKESDKDFVKITDDDDVE